MATPYELPPIDCVAQPRQNNSAMLLSIFGNLCTCGLDAWRTERSTCLGSQESLAEFCQSTSVVQLMGSLEEDWMWGRKILAVKKKEIGEEILVEES